MAVLKYAAAALAVLALAGCAGRGEETEDLSGYVSFSDLVLNVECQLRDTLTAARAYAIQSNYEAQIEITVEATRVFSAELPNLTYATPASFMLAIGPSASREASFRQTVQLPSVTVDLAQLHTLTCPEPTLQPFHAVNVDGSGLFTPLVSFASINQVSGPASAVRSSFSFSSQFRLERGGSLGATASVAGLTASASVGRERTDVHTIIVAFAMKNPPPQIATPTAALLQNEIEEQRALIE